MFQGKFRYMKGLFLEKKNRMLLNIKCQMNPKSLAMISLHVIKVHLQKVLVKKKLDKNKKKGLQITSDLEKKVTKYKIRRVLFDL